ncbi:hypothetical protein [Litoribaculum gwangyangense]|jgi:hypothetical protein
MKTNYLLPHKYKKLGWLLFLIGLIGGIVVSASNFESTGPSIKVLAIYSESFLNSKSHFFQIIENEIFDEIVSLFIIIGGLVVGFTKEKIEDEFIHKLRHESLVWAFIVNYIVLLFTIIFIYDMAFFDVLVYNMFTPLIFFIIRFNFLKLKSGDDEE